MIGADAALHASMNQPPDLRRPAKVDSETHPLNSFYCFIPINGWPDYSHGSYQLSPNSALFPWTQVLTPPSTLHDWVL
jgi:hypothetical protein